MPSVKQTSLDRVIACIDTRKSFLLEAGAGSGKTWSLIQGLRHVLAQSSAALLSQNQKVVCITYTNVAKDEISERIDFNPLVLVLTIHEFLWHVISTYQTELKTEIIAFDKAKSKAPIEGLEGLLKTLPIIYTEYGRHFDEGKISHDDVLEFSRALFEKYPKISRIVARRFPFIFIDEYQDTDPNVVHLLLNNLLPESRSMLTLGFFGDSMQKIYNTGVGAIDHADLEKITKEENFRCSEAVIGVLNKMRPELQQKLAGQNLKGRVSFFHSNRRLGDPRNYSAVMSRLVSKNGWPSDGHGMKILMLTHKGIADQLDYRQLIKVYTDRYSFGRERLYEKEDRFSDYLFNKIELLCDLYAAKTYADCVQLIGSARARLKKHSDKEHIRKLMDQLVELRKTGTIRDVMNFVTESGLLAKSDKVEEFKERITAKELDESGAKDKAFFEALMATPYREVARLHRFIEDSTPFSTKHGVKGAEFDRVLVVIDDAAWNQYSFNDVFSGKREKKDRFNRTLNLLYVCCSRPKDELAVLALSKLDDAALRTIDSWFGKDNVFDVSTL